MGIPRRDGGGSTFMVNIRPLIKTHPDSQGIGLLDIPDGTQIVATGLHMWPNHDRGMHSALRKFLNNGTSKITIMLGSILNEEAFKQVVDSKDRTHSFMTCREAPEICKIKKELDDFEERVLALAKLGGEYVADFAKFGPVFYIPSAASSSGALPNEAGLMDFVLTQKEKLDKRAENKPDEYREGPPIPTRFDEFLRIHNHENIKVMDFGQALRVNDCLTFATGNFKRRHPGSAVYVDVEHNLESMVRASAGMVASTWWNTPEHSLVGPHFRSWQGHEVGHGFDLKQLGFMGKYERRAKGIWVGTVMGGQVTGTAFVPLIGEDGRRSFVIDGIAYDEDAPWSPARTHQLKLPASFGKTKAAAVEAAAVVPTGSAKMTGVGILVTSESTATTNPSKSKEKVSKRTAKAPSKTKSATGKVKGKSKPKSLSKAKRTKGKK